MYCDPFYYDPVFALPRHLWLNGERPMYTTLAIPQTGKHMPFAADSTGTKSETATVSISV
jgi:hypothetical protein